MADKLPTKVAEAFETLTQPLVKNINRLQKARDEKDMSTAYWCLCINFLNYLTYAVFFLCAALATPFIGIYKNLKAKYAS